MEARILSATMIVASALSLGAGYRTRNFVVTAPTSQLAREIGASAETYRRELAIEWLGHELPSWPSPCPVTAQVGPHLGAGGATTFTFENGHPVFWTMNIQGSHERLLDSVLPHEVTHTIFATHFLRPLPRWADEGACTTVEHPSEKAKQHKLLYTFLTTGRGIAFNRMFAMKEYPSDILPLYSQGYSLARFLIAQGDRRKFVHYVGDGMRSNNWTAATKKHYGYNSLSDLQVSWLDWVRRGCPAIAPKGTMVAVDDSPQAKRSAPSGTARLEGQSTADTGQLAARIQPEPPSDGWYVRQRDRAQNTRQATSPVSPQPETAPDDRSRAVPRDTPVVQSSVARPQPIGTPRPVVIPLAPQSTVPYGAPSMVPVPLAPPQALYSFPASRP